MSLEIQRLPDIDDIQLWMVAGLPSEDEQQALLTLLNEDERARYERFQVDEARLSFLISRGSLRRLLGEHLGVDPTSLTFGRGRHGKPFLDGEHAGIEFNVSHSKEMFVYAVTRERIVGIDVEHMKAERPFDRLAERFFAPGEAQRLLEEGRREDTVENFYRCWTRKEAYLKAKGLGITMQLDAFEVTFLPEEAPALKHTEIDGEDPSTWECTEIEVPGPYKAALVRGPVGARSA